MSEMLMAIFLVYSTSGITSGKKVCRELKMAAILKILKYETQRQIDLRYENIVPNYATNSIKHSFNLTSDMKRSSQIMPIKFFMVMTSSMTSQGGFKVSLYIHV